MVYITINLPILVGIAFWKQAHHQHEMTLEGRMRELQGRLETQEVECRRLEWAHNDSVKEKEVQVQR